MSQYSYKNSRRNFDLGAQGLRGAANMLKRLSRLKIQHAFFSLERTLSLQIPLSTCVPLVADSGSKYNIVPSQNQDSTVLCLFKLMSSHVVIPLSPAYDSFMQRKGLGPFALSGVYLFSLRQSRPSVLNHNEAPDCTVALCFRQHH